MQIISLVRNFSEADPILIEFWIWVLCKIRYLWELLLSFSDTQQCFKNVNHRPKVKRTLKTSNSKVIASSLLLVIVLSAICDVTGELSCSHSSTFASENRNTINSPRRDEARIIDTARKRKNVSDFCLEISF